MNFDSEDFSQSKTFSILGKQGGSGKLFWTPFLSAYLRKNFFEGRKNWCTLILLPTRPVLPPLNLALLAVAANPQSLLEGDSALCRRLFYLPRTSKRKQQRNRR